MNLKPNDFFIDQSKGKTYKVDSQIGKTTHGAMYQVEDVYSKEKYKLKVQNSITERELDLLKLLCNKRFTNVVNTISFGQYQHRYPYSIMEYGNENLYETITYKGTFKNEQFRYVAHQIATGLKELHDLGLIHRDINPENIMQFNHVDKVTKKMQKTYKICNFGLEGDSAQFPFKGTPYYRAPEQLQSQAKNYTNKVDIWALGAVFYEIIQGEPLFRAHTLEQIYELIKNSKIDDKINKLDLKPEYKKLIKDMLNREQPNQRPIISVVLNVLGSQCTIIQKGFCNSQIQDSKLEQQYRSNSENIQKDQNFQFQRNLSVQAGLKSSSQKSPTVKDKGNYDNQEKNHFYTEQSSQQPQIISIMQQYKLQEENQNSNYQFKVK